MELKQYIQIIKQNKYLFFGVWLVVILAGEFWLGFSPRNYQAVLTLDIAREGRSMVKEQHGFDQFYRMEANDRFAKVVVQWLKDPNTKNAIFSRTEKVLGEDNLSLPKKTFKAEQLAPGFIQLKFKTEKPQQARKIAAAVRIVMAQKTNGLNQNFQEQNWFKIIFSGPAVEIKPLPFWPVMIGTILVGLLSAIIVVMGRHYWRD